MFNVVLLAATSAVLRKLSCKLDANERNKCHHLISWLVWPGYVLVNEAKTSSSSEQSLKHGNRISQPQSFSISSSSSTSFGSTDDDLGNLMVALIINRMCAFFSLFLSLNLTVSLALLPIPTISLSRSQDCYLYLPIYSSQDML